MVGDFFRDPWSGGCPLPLGRYPGNFFISFGEIYRERPFPFWENPALYFSPDDPRIVSNRKRTIRKSDRQLDDDRRIPLRLFTRENPHARRETTKLKRDEKQTRSSRPNLSQASPNIPSKIQPWEEIVFKSKGTDPCDGTNEISEKRQASVESTERSSTERSLPGDHVSTEAERAKESSPVVDNDDSQPETQAEQEKKLTAIETELARAKELIPRVAAFEGTRQDKEFLYLEECLTRCVLSLDLIATDGQENVKSARRATVKEILSIVNDLEEKVRH